MAGEENFGDLLIQALKEARAHARGELEAREHRVVVTARDLEVAPPPRYTAAQIQTVRRRLKVSQPVFANALNVSASTVRAWERGVREPEGPSLRLLEIAERYPAALFGQRGEAPTEQLPTA